MAILLLHLPRKISNEMKIMLETLKVMPAFVFATPTRGVRGEMSFNRKVYEAFASHTKLALENLFRSQFSFKKFFFSLSLCSLVSFLIQ